MTNEPVSARPGIWDAVFALVFGRRGAPAPRPKPAPQPQPAPPRPAPQPEPSLGPTPEPAIEQPPAPTLETPPPAPAPAAPIETPPAAAPVAAITPFVQHLVDFCVSEWNLFQQGALKETEESASARIAAYWANVGEDSLSGKDTDHPWSAAFISFAMKEAGDNGKFKKSISHSTYINDAIKRAGDPEAPFHGKRIEEYAPQLGDLICRRRGDETVTFDSAPNMSWYPSHTDVVTAIKPGKVEMIGGNVSHSVSVSDLKLLPDGRLDPVEAAQHKVFAIMKNNL